MPDLIRCTACAVEVRVARRHRGQTVACPGCGSEIPVPLRLGFRENALQAAADRRSGHWLLTFAWVSGLSCLPVAPAVVWFLCNRRIEAARDDGRDTVEPLLAARLVAVTGFCCHAIYVLAAAIDAAFLPVQFFSLG